MEEISFKIILRGKELDKAEEYLYSIKNAIKEDIVEQNCEFEDFDVVITEYLTTLSLLQRERVK